MRRSGMSSVSGEGREGAAECERPVALGACGSAGGVARVVAWVALLAVLLLVAGCASSGVGSSETDGDGLDDVSTEPPPVGASDGTSERPIDDVEPTWTGDDAGDVGSEDDEPRLCTTDEDCDFEPCVPLDDDGSVGVCSEFCDLASDCPEGFQCTLLRRTGADAQRVCLPSTFCLDRDGDGYGVGPGCAGPDCDDTDPDVNPGRREWCEGKDTSCSGEVDDDPQFGLVGGEQVAIGEPCDTGFPGVCSAGQWACELGQTICAPMVQPAAQESCNGLDDTCDGYVDQTSDGQPLVRSFYRGPEGTEGIGQCTSGVEVCQEGEWVVTADQVIPGEERCDALDWSCSGTPDDVTEESLAGNRSHCGECGNACEEWQDCRDGACTCPAEREECGEACVDTVANNLHCGACDNACPPDAICMNGACNCGVGRAACGERCVDLVIDRSNCGACGNRCASEQFCESGECRCPVGRTLCGELCVELATNANHCGGCGTQCPSGQICSGGTCGCPAGAPLCDGVCTDLQNDRSNCGACGATCHADQVCSGGQCLCLGETSLCADGCRNLSSDTSNCGDCGTACHADQSCSSGECRCPSGGSLCADGCRNLSSDTSNCGDCGTVCHADQSCSSGECRCPSGGSLCADGCRNLSSDTSSCGECGRACGVGQQCVDGNCICPGGGTSCPDGCRDLTSDNNNCGACGEVCPGDTFCSAGTCRCASGLSRCGDACVTEQVGSNCYTSSSGTPGVGICSYGTWTCSGESAVCSGETGPEPRVCDGRDNNCNGTVDDGCPHAILFGPINTGPFYGGTGGTSFTRDCSPGQVVVGVDGRSGSRMDRLQLRCQSLALVIASSVVPHSFSIDRTGTASLLPANGGTGGTPFTFTCPPGEVVVEIRGRSGSEVDRFQVRCGRYSVTGNSPGNYGVSRALGTLSPAWGGTGGTAFTYTCPDDGALRGLVVRSGARIDRVQPRCNTIGLQIR